MIATALLIKNFNEVQEAKKEIEKLGYGEEVKPEFTEREFCFALASLLCSFLNDDGNIKVILMNQEIILKYDKKVYERIKEHFKNI